MFAQIGWPLLLGMPGYGELLVILLIVLVVFGGKKLPEVARSMGQAMRAFKDEANKMQQEIQIEGKKADDEPKQETSASTSKSSTSTGAEGQSKGPSQEIHKAA